MKIPLAIPNLLGREAAYLQDCITSTVVSTVGAFVAQFEAGIATLSGMAKAVVLFIRTTALNMALADLCIGAVDLVIRPVSAGKRVMGNPARERQA